MIHNTKFAQYLAPTSFHYAIGVWTQVAGQVANTVVMHKSAVAETAVITIPVSVFSNSVPLNGSKLMSVEIDYEVQVADLTSITATIWKVTRGVEGAVAVPAAVTFTQSPTTALAKAVEQHKLVLTLTTPAWVANTEYYLVQLSCVAPATTTLDILGAVANFTFRA
jgi:uncharacterized membrane protein YGL010W